VLDGTYFLVLVFVVAPVFFGARTKNMIRKSIPSCTKTEQLFCVACVTLTTWRSGYGTTSQKCRVTHPVVRRLQKWSKIF
jgi:hypothetical protein